MAHLHLGAWGNVRRGAVDTGAAAGGVGGGRQRRVPSAGAAVGGRRPNCQASPAVRFFNAIKRPSLVSQAHVVAPGATLGPWGMLWPLGLLGNPHAPMDVPAVHVPLASLPPGSPAHELNSTAPPGSRRYIVYIHT
jgi:hypothetical protein